MFKIGDRVRIIGLRSDQGLRMNGQVDYVSQVHKTGDILYYSLRTTGHGVWPDELKLINEPLTEIDFLNCFQNNFKEGV